MDAKRLKKIALYLKYIAFVLEREAHDSETKKVPRKQPTKGTKNA